MFERNIMKIGYRFALRVGLCGLLISTFAPLLLPISIKIPTDVMIGSVTLIIGSFILEYSDVKDELRRMKDYKKGLESEYKNTRH